LDRPHAKIDGTLDTTFPEAGFNDLKRVLQNAARQCAEVIEHDRGPRADRHGAAFVLALRRWNYSGFARFKRSGGIAADPK
jgi:hypothetical protein